MTRKFNIGDRVRIIKIGSPKYGTVTTVVRIRTDATLYVGMSNDKIVVPIAYEVDIPTSHPAARWCGYEPEHLEPYYDGNEKVSWSECAWQPKSITVC